MRISNVSIENLRSVASMSVNLDSVTTLIGGNNAGKSTTLRALQAFFEPAPKLTDDDYYKRDADQISITVKFKDFTPSERQEFQRAIADGEMTITRTFSRTDASVHQQYSVSTMAFAPFEAIRGESNKTTKRSMYNAWAQESDFNKAASSDEVDTRMEEWETQHPELLTRTTVRGFFGVPNVACGKLRKKTSVHYVPAVADANEETGNPRSSPLINLLTEIAKQVFENKQEVKEFIDNTTQQFHALTNPENFQQLANISSDLTSTIQKYYKDSRLLAEWQPAEGLKVTFPQPSIKIEDNGFISGLQNVGHGLQRAALFSVIEFLSTNSQRVEAVEGEQFEEAQSDIILLIEEPEIYQHPSKQQIIYDTFHELCSAFNAQTGIRFQIIFTTHSEKFIGINKFHSARILRKKVLDQDLAHSCAGVAINECSQYFSNLINKPALSDAAFEARMHIFSRELCEGFFANKIILVEGVTDKAVLAGAYKSAGRNPEAEGISILAADGKTKMDKPLHIFRKLGIPTFPVFDSDANKKKPKPETNILLQKILDIEEPNEFPDGCFAKFCAYSDNMEQYLKATAGELWEGHVENFKEEFGFDPEDICKTPEVISRICRSLRENGVNIARFDQIIAAVDELPT